VSEGIFKKRTFFFLCGGRGGGGGGGKWPETSRCSVLMPGIEWDTCKIQYRPLTV